MTQTSSALIEIGIVRFSVYRISVKQYKALFLFKLVKNKNWYSSQLLFESEQKTIQKI